MDSPKTPELDHLNELPTALAAERLRPCCGSARWVEGMLVARPFTSVAALLAGAEAVWAGLDGADWLEAFGHHPRIGDRESLRAKFASTARWAEGEQAGTAAASDKILDELAAANVAYEERYGYIFIVCATGKSAQEMLELLRARMDNEAGEELKVAATEQAKITSIRLMKLIDEGAQQ